MTNRMLLKFQLLLSSERERENQDISMKIQNEIPTYLIHIFPFLVSLSCPANTCKCHLQSRIL